MRYSRMFFNQGGEIHEFGELSPRKKYGIMKFLFDFFMALITHGWWLVWVIYREVRK